MTTSDEQDRDTATLSPAFIARQRRIIEERLARYYRIQLPRNEEEPEIRKSFKNRFIPVLEEALRRIDSGAYGTCVDCGESIGKARLELVPAAMRCTECQAEFEQHHDIVKKR